MVNVETTDLSRIPDAEMTAMFRKVLSTAIRELSDSAALFHCHITDDGMGAVIDAIKSLKKARVRLKE